MKNRVRGLVGLVFAALLCFALPALGQNTNMYFNGGYQGDAYCGGSEGCVATGFYDGSINGVNVGPSQSSPGMICDDYNHNIVSGESWTANGIDAAALNVNNIGQTEFAGFFGGGTAALQGYTELAYLVNQMFTTSPNSATQSALSQAIWFISSGGTSTANQKGVLTGLALTFYNNAVAFLNAGGNLSGFANLWIYTPSPNDGPQEMWSTVMVPEGGAAWMYLLLAGVSCFGAMFFRSRNQASKPGMA